MTESYDLRPKCTQYKDPPGLIEWALYGY